MVRRYEDNKQVKLVNDVLTKEDLVNFFKAMKISKGMILYVQSNMLDCAYVNGGNQTIIEALQEVVGYEGSIVTSAFSEQLIDPACNQEYIFERDVYDEMRDTIEPFHKKKTPADNEFANQLMRNDAIYRSNHPTHSCVAWGKYAKLICDKHPLHFSLGKDSFLDKICEMNGYVLLLGVDYEHCDIFKYASTLAMASPIKITASPIDKKGDTQIINMLSMDYKDKGINHIKQMLEERRVVNDSFIASAHCRFFKAKEAANLSLAYYHSFK